MLGYEHDDLPLRWDALTPPEWREMDEAKLSDLAETGVASPWVKQYWHRDGHRLPILLGVALLEGSETDTVGFVLDRTAQVRAEAELRATSERFRQLYDDLPLMYFMLDGNGVIESVNAHGASELGYLPAELQGRPVLEVFHPEDREAVERHLGSIFKGSGGVEPMEFRKIRKDGTTLWVQETIRTIAGPDGEMRLLVICEDISERRAAAQRLAEQERRLQQLTRSVATVEEGERRRIGKGLHDEVVQNLAVAKLKLGDLDRLDPGRQGRRIARPDP
jgi:PAS domain S-box-containing protein